jgi:hypothetical protein
MADSFLDTSALVKYYHREEGTQEVTRIIEEPDSRHSISRLSLVETVSAFAVKFRTETSTSRGLKLFVDASTMILVSVFFGSCP